jgi:hypothetical protein
MAATAPVTREERKVVTVSFADLVGFTLRSEQLDPEDVRAFLSSAGGVVPVRDGVHRYRDLHQRRLQCDSRGAPERNHLSDPRPPPTPGATGSYLQGVSCAPATACTAVGYYTNDATLT